MVGEVKCYRSGFPFTFSPHAQQRFYRTAVFRKGGRVSENDAFVLRLVIQQLEVSENPGYRLTVYGDDFAPRHTDFDNEQILLKALRAAIPSFDFSKIVMNPLAKGQGSMAFVGEMKLDKTHLSLLGLS